MILFGRKGNEYETNLVKITDNIFTPVPTGQKQHGLAKWLYRKEFDRCFNHYVLDRDVYYFIANMCHMEGKDLPLNKYMKTLAPTHPAKALLGILDVAPSRTRESFFTAALTTLSLFTNLLIYSMTCISDFRPEDTGVRKRTLFMVLPDQKTTYYSLASLSVAQHYELLVNVADKRGGRLEGRVNLILDEFGNFTQISAFANKLTVGSGRGIRFIFVDYLVDYAYKNKLVNFVGN